MASLKIVVDDSPAVLPQSPQGLVIRDPGVMSSSHSFTDLEFQSRHTVDVGIGKAQISQNFLFHFTIKQRGGL